MRVFEFLVLFYPFKASSVILFFFGFLILNLEQTGGRISNYEKTAAAPPSCDQYVDT